MALNQIAPPLLLLALPRTIRVSLRGHGKGAALASLLLDPWAATTLFIGLSIAVSLPGVFDPSVANALYAAPLGVLELLSGLLFWARVIDPGPLRPRLVWPARIAYAVGAMVVGWALAIGLVLAPHPLYAHYAEFAHRPGGISALTDQQLAAGMMWVPGSISYTIAFLIGFYRWLEPERGGRPSRPALTT